MQDQFKLIIFQLLKPLIFVVECEYDGQLIKSEKRNKPKRPSGPPRNGQMR